MLNFKYIRSGLVATVLTLILSFGPAPQSHLVGDAPSVRFSDSSGTNNSSSEIFEGIPAQAASVDSGTTYYILRRDVRRCAFPMCGGYFVSRVNRSLTRCFNSKYMKECYVAEIDWNGRPQIETHGALLRGRIAPKSYSKFGKLGEFRVTESWQAPRDKNATGVFYRVIDRGVRCITHPCLTHHETKLNSIGQRHIAGVDLSGAGANDSAVSQATDSMTTADGIIVAGSHVPVTGPAGKAIMLKASQFYLRAASDAGSKTNKTCIKTGCSGQVCADSEVITTCEWRPEYACYRRARCERQSDGKCGFTRTPALSECLARQ